MNHHRFATAILLLISLSLAFSLSLPGCSKEKPQEDLRAKAWEFMTKSVATKLGNPKDLTFPPDGTSNVTPLAGNRFQITSFADFTNAQGQQDHAYFHGTLVYANGAWALENLKFAE